MRNFFIRFLLITILSSCSPSTGKGLFRRDDEQLQQQLKDTEQQLVIQREKTGSWAVVAGCLGIGCVLLFVIGTAIGSRTKHAPRT